MSEKVEIGDQPDNPSRTGSLLRLFAKAVALEERDLSNSTDRLIQAADEVLLNVVHLSQNIQLHPPFIITASATLSCELMKC